MPPLRSRERFWNAAGYLNDVVDVDGRAGERDVAFRPNQIFASADLPCRCSTWRRRAPWWMPSRRGCGHRMGLGASRLEIRAIAPRYAGGPVERDGAYHQGTVWPWLAGPFIEAWVRVRGETAAGQTPRRGAVSSLPCLAHLESCGTGPPGRDRRRGAAAHAARLPLPGLVDGRAAPAGSRSPRGY